MAYKPIPEQEEGNRKEVKTADDNVEYVLREILKQLKIMNVHLSLLTEIDIKKGDIN